MSAQYKGMDWNCLLDYLREEQIGPSNEIRLPGHLQGRAKPPPPLCQHFQGGYVDGRTSRDESRGFRRYVPGSSPRGGQAGKAKVARRADPFLLEASPEVLLQADPFVPLVF